ncbi:hypothetical protein UFOVP407_48 [uncultured Caudovirales phage]|uniref:Uncharacterized protein n=1 Tax=uncultured Caudovirales phage TaxID=2100421 RepID=A0A6J5M9B9_9CAUD|nr:hypothetical protein UFOVP407_48 [uncultured Caudovirales phage]
MVERMTDEEEARWQAGVKMLREEQPKKRDRRRKAPKRPETI